MTLLASMQMVFILGFVVLLAACAGLGFGWSVRRQRQFVSARTISQVVQAQSASHQPPQLPLLAKPKTRWLARSPGHALATVTDEELTCPSCQRGYVGKRFCTSDGRRLAPAHELKQRGRGVVCVVCRRACDAGVSKCPHDNLPLVPFSTHAIDAVRPMGARRAPTQPAHVLARICPLCGGRDDLHARYCGRDGAALLVIN
jgi:hypothetical protein